MKVWRLLLAALAVLGGLHVANASPLTKVDDVYAALEAGRYDDVESFYERVQKSRERDSEGTFVFEEFYRSVYWYSSTDPNDPAYWPKIDAATLRWLNHSPESHLAAMTRAFALAYHAEVVQARGGSWADVDRLAAEARRLMERSRKSGATDVLWHATLLRVASIEGAPRSDVRDMILSAAAVDPYPLRLWQEASIALSPAGRGTEDLPWLMGLAAQRTSEREGSSMYARVLGTAFWHFPDFTARPFFGTGVDWNLLNESFVEWKARYPGAYLQDLHAALACAAMDQPRTAALLAGVRAAPRQDIWKFFGGDGFLARCTAFAAPPVPGPKI